jgi:hypothetical protein
MEPLLTNSFEEAERAIKTNQRIHLLSCSSNRENSMSTPVSGLHFMVWSSPAYGLTLLALTLQANC